MSATRYLFGMLISAGLITGCVTKVVNSDGSLQPTVIDKEKLSDTYVNLALEYQKHNAPQVALDRVNLAVDANSSNARAFMVRAMIYQQLNKPNAAENDFKKSISLRKEYPDAYVNYASFLCSQKRYDEAMDKFAIALNDPLYFTPEIGYYNRGQCYNKQKLYTEANADFMQSLMYKNAPADSFLALAKLQYEQKHYLLAKYYIDKYNDTQTPESLWLHIQILQALLDNDTDVVRDREYTSYRNTIAKVLVDNYGNSSEAQQCILKYGQPSALSYGFSNKNYVKPAPLVVTNTAVPKAAVAANGGVLTDQNGRRYVIMPKGITVYSLGRQYGVSVKQLEQYNKVRASHMKVGMKIFLDPVQNNTSLAAVKTSNYDTTNGVNNYVQVSPNNTHNQPSAGEAVVSNVVESHDTTLNSSNPAININNSTDSEIKQDASGRRYLVVLQGMTAYSISRKYNLTVRQLENYNKMHSAQIITGMKLYIDPR